MLRCAAGRTLRRFRAGRSDAGCLRSGVGFSTAALGLAPAATASHLAMPEGTLFHNGKIYVSLIGDPENNDGSVVTVDATGKVTGHSRGQVQPSRSSTQLGWRSGARHPKQASTSNMHGRSWHLRVERG
jgi:hypothetical protein